MSDPFAPIPSERHFAGASREPLRVAFVITELDPGGAERALVQIVTRLDRSRFEPRVYSLAEPGPLVRPLEEADVPVRSLHRRGARVLTTIPRLRREWNRWRPDVVQGFLFQANLVARLALPKKPRPIMICGHRVADRRGRWRFQIERLVKSKADHHVCVSEGVRQFIRQHLRLPTECTSVIPNGVDFRTYAEASPLPRDELSLPNTSPLLINVGRLDPQKRQDRLIGAVAGLKHRFPTLGLIIVGEGPDRMSLEREIVVRGVADHVRLPGRREDVPALLKTADLFVLTSEWEGMPNVVLEAFASGCPVASTGVEGIDELIRIGNTGWLLPNEPPEALVDELGTILETPQMWESFATNAQHLVATRFTWERVAIEYGSLFERLVQTRDHRR